jgi:rfaE bifunctional protein nucleotidyltransferase chain/domain
LREKVVSPEELPARLDALRSSGKKIVQCHGCFDVVHPGHIRYLAFAREQGDALLVSVTADASVGKGINRPYFSEQLRAENLAALECVDLVVVDNHDSAEALLEQVRPDVYIKGKEYERLTDARFVREKNLVESYGGSVVFGSGDVVFSSTELLRARGAAGELEHTRLVDFCKRHGITTPNIAEVLGRAARASVVVVGDPIIDHYTHCERARVSAEGPLLSVTPVSEEFFAGGAALIACTLAEFGLQVTFVTTMSGSPQFSLLRERLEEANVRIEALPTERRPVFVKQRYVVDGKKVLKVDFGHPTPLSSTESVAFGQLLDRTIEGADALICTDFGYGVFGLQVIQHVQRLVARTGTRLVVDVSTHGHSNLLKFARPSLATPTEEELRYALADEEAGLSNLASRYYRETGAGGLCVTLGSKGAVYFAPPEDGRTDRLLASFVPALVRHPIDPVGAGDLFLSGMLMSDLGEGSRQLGIYLGSCMSAVGCGQLGNPAVTRSQLERYLRSRAELTQ